MSKLSKTKQTKAAKISYSHPIIEILENRCSKQELMDILHCGDREAREIVDKNLIAPTFMENHGKIMAIFDYKSSPNYRNMMFDDSVIPTLYAQDHYGIVEKQPLRIRKLTPQECFKIMGVKTSDYNKLTVSKSQKYKQAGNSIVTTCLMAIYSQLFNDIDYKKKISELVEELIE